MDNIIHSINLQYPHINHPYLFQDPLNPTHLSTFSQSHSSFTYLEFSHYNQLASAALTLVLNNDWSTAINLLQSHRLNCCCFCCSVVAFIILFLLFLFCCCFYYYCSCLLLLLLLLFLLLLLLFFFVIFVVVVVVKVVVSVVVIVVPFARQ